MSRYIVQRILQAIIVIIIVTLLVFFVMHLLPGDPILMYLSQEQVETLSKEQIELTRQEFGLDKPLMIQYLNWIGGVFHGDLGMSLFYNEDVGELLARRIPVTLHLGLISFVISNILGITAGIISALRRGSFIDSIVTFVANIGITVPIFWMGILLIYLFGLKLAWLPICGYTAPGDDFWLNTRQIIMPIACLAVFPIGAIARQARSSMLEVTRQDYVRTAWSKGLSERKIIISHMLKNGLIPLVTLAGVSISQILGGSVLIETVFNISGVGRLAVDALMSLDYSVVQAIILMTASMVVLSSLIVDISYGWLDPRVSYQ